MCLNIPLSLCLLMTWCSVYDTSVPEYTNLFRKIALAPMIMLALPLFIVIDIITLPFYLIKLAIYKCCGIYPSPNDWYAHICCGDHMNEAAHRESMESQVYEYIYDSD